MQKQLQRAPKGPGGYVRSDDPGEPVLGTPRVSITDLEAEILSALVIGSSVLEIGTGLGVSTRALARTAVEVVTYDIDPWVRETIWPELIAEYSNVKTTDDPSEWVMDTVFIDADHSAGAVAADVQTALKVIGQDGDGLIIAHDANDAKVRRGLGDGWTVIPTEHGLGVMIVNR